MSDVSPALRNMVREVITNAYYNARNGGHTMEQAADDATAGALKIITSVHENARLLGQQQGIVMACEQILLERSDEEEPFIARLRDDAYARLELARLTAEAMDRG